MGGREMLFTSAPYPGLRPFSASESDIFFGREEQVDKLLEKLEQNRFLALVGASGCGKSSLVRAGLIAALEAGFMGEAGHRWRIADLRPGNEPLLRLAEALLDPRALGAELASTTSPAAAHAQLRRGPLGLVELVREARLPEGTNLLVLVDQFEEIFRFRRLGNPNTADAFVALLLETARCRREPVFVVLTMRSDFLGDCAVFRGLPEAISESEFLTPRLTREQIGKVIAAPARMFGGEADATLVNRLVNDVGPDPDQLPVLQHALMRMWSRAEHRAAVTQEPPLMTIDDYAAIGGLRAALSNHGDELLNDLPAERRRLAQTMFSCLTERGEGRRDTRRPATVREIAEVAHTDPSEAAAVADLFRAPGVSFLTPPQPVPLTPDSVLDISHESLIRVWASLAAWVEEEAERASVYVRLKQAAELWKQGAADLWSGRQVNNAKAWAAAVQPTTAWALRYGSREDFDAAMSFLAASKRQDRARKLTRWIGAAALVALVVGASVREVHRLDRQVAELRSVQQALHSVDLASVDGDRALLDATQAACDYPNPVVRNSLARVLSGRHELHRMRAPADSNLLALGYSQAQATVLVALADDSAMLLRPAEGSSRRLDVPTGSVPAGGAISSGSARVALLLKTKPEPSKLEIRVWELAAEPVLVSTLEAGVPLVLIALDPRGRTVAGVTAGGALTTWDLTTGAPRFAGSGGKHGFSEISGLQFSDDGQRVMIAGSDRAEGPDSLGSDVVVVVDAHTGAPIQEVRKPAADPSFAWGAALAPGGRRLATLAQNGTLEVYDLTSRKRTLSLGLRLQGPNGLAFFPDGNTVAVQSLGGELRIVGLETMEDWPLSGGGTRLRSAAPSPSGTEMLAQGFDSTYRVLRMPRQLVAGAGREIVAAAFTADGKQAALGLESGEVLLRDPDQRSEGRLRLAAPEDAPGPGAGVSRLAFSPGGASLAVAHADGRIRIWNVRSRGLSVEVQHPEPGASQTRLRCVAFSPDGTQIVSTGEDDTVRVWNALDGSAIGRPVGSRNGDPPKCATFDSEGSGIFVITQGGTLLRWRPGDENNITATQLDFKGAVLDGGGVQQARFVPVHRDGTTMVAASGVLAGGGLPVTWVWKLSPAGEPSAAPRELAGQSDIAGFAADGTRIGTLDGRATFTVWDVDSKMQITAHQAERMGELSPAGDRMLIVGETGAWFEDCQGCGGYEEVLARAHPQAMAIVANEAAVDAGRDMLSSCRVEPARSEKMLMALREDRDETKRRRR
ncbi:MAG TPA: AAA family ATPase [Burkholderiales bacterium]|nr:AAA family ATPase [Burkholderiales bacterium]